MTLREKLLECYDDKFFEKNQILKIVILHENKFIGSEIYYADGLKREYFEKLSDNRFLFAMRNCDVTRSELRKIKQGGNEYNSFEVYVNGEVKIYLS